MLDRLVHFFERVHIRPLRSQALKSAEKWMLERLEMSDGLGAIYPGIMNSIIALRCLGYSLDDPQVIRAMDEFEKLGIEEETHLPHAALHVAGVGHGLCGLCAWRERRVRHRSAPGTALRMDAEEAGDAPRRLVREESARPRLRGWYFEFNNEFYPDVDDSAQVLLALSRVKTSNESYHTNRCSARSTGCLSMQCKNGGWASFDKDNDRMVFQHIPFADHNAMLDPPTVDITGRVLECLATYGYSLKDAPVRRAVEFIKREQEAGWFLVRALGRELHLRHHAGAARPGSGRLDYHEPWCSRRQSGCA